MKVLIILMMVANIAFASDTLPNLPSGELRSVRLDASLLPATYPDVSIKPVTERSYKQWRTWGRPLTAVVLGALSGFTHATREVIIIDHSKFEAKFSGSNDLYWDPDISWRNKFKNGDSAQGERFWKSTSAFAVVTDAYHALPWAERTLFAGGTAVVFIGDTKRPVWRYALDFVLLSVSYGLASHFTYDKFYRMPSY